MMAKQEQSIMNSVKATWTGGLAFETATDSGHTLVTDAPTESGGLNSAPSPVELILVGLAACTGVDIASILTKMKVPPEALEIIADAERAVDHPRIFPRSN
jgi:putative redox protein